MYRYKFNTHDQDTESGLLYYKARFYDPAIGRFITPDTIMPDPTKTQSYNRYAYVEGNPVTFQVNSKFFSTYFSPDCDRIYRAFFERFPRFVVKTFPMPLFFRFTMPRNFSAGETRPWKNVILRVAGITFQWKQEVREAKNYFCFCISFWSSIFFLRIILIIFSKEIILSFERFK